MQIQALDPGLLDLAVNIPSAAFAEYPVITRVLDAADSAYAKRMRK